MANEALKLANMEKANSALLDNMVKRGITATTKELIARETGLSLASIVRYYPSKDDMVLAALTEISKGQEARCGNYTGNGAQQLTQFLDDVLKNYFEEPEMYALRMEIISYAHYAETDALSKLIEAVGLRKKFAEILTLGREDGSLHLKLDLEAAVNYYPNILFGFMSDLASRHDVTAPEHKEKARNIIRNLMDEIKTILGA